jgi:hypothetical protein
VQFRGACYAATSADEVYGLFRAAENPAAAAASRGA